MLLLWILNVLSVWMSLTDAADIKSFAKISSTAGNLTAVFSTSDFFGYSSSSFGDLDAILVGAYGDDDGGTYRGAVYILFLDNEGVTLSHQKVSDLHSDFTGILEDNDKFGMSVCHLDDLNGDQFPDILVGAPEDDDNGEDRGAVYILFVDAVGLVESHQKISDLHGDLPSGLLTDSDEFGGSVGNIGDLDGDDLSDIAVGASGDDDGGSGRGLDHI